MPATVDLNLTPVAPGIAGTPVQTGTSATTILPYVGTTASRAFDATTSWFSRVDTNGGQIGSNQGTFYGGAFATVSNPLSTTAVLYRGNDADPTETARFQGGSSQTSPFATFNGQIALLMDLSVTDGTFTADSYLQSFQNSTSTIKSGRWLAYAGTTIFISSTTYTPSTSVANVSGAAITLNNPDEIFWAPWIPDAELDNIPALESFTILGSTLMDISKIGVWTQHQNDTPASRTYNLASLQAMLETQQVVPEPASIVSLFGLGVLALARRRA